MLYFLLNECSLGEHKRLKKITKSYWPQTFDWQCCCIDTLLCNAMTLIFSNVHILTGVIVRTAVIFLLPTDNHNKLCKLVGLQAHTLFTKFTVTKYKQQFLPPPWQQQWKSHVLYSTVHSNELEAQQQFAFGWFMVKNIGHMCEILACVPLLDCTCRTVPTMNLKRATNSCRQDETSSRNIT